jgi:hypothetical protein
MVNLNEELGVKIQNKNINKIREIKFLNYYN